MGEGLGCERNGQTGREGWAGSMRQVDSQAGRAGWTSVEELNKRQPAAGDMYSWGCHKDQARLAACGGGDCCLRNATPLACSNAQQTRGSQRCGHWGTWPAGQRSCKWQVITFMKTGSEQHCRLTPTFVSHTCPLPPPSGAGCTLT